MQYTQSQPTTTPQPFAIKVADGWEFFSNGRDIKYELRKATFFDAERGLETSCYNASCFIFEDGGWLQGSNGSIVESVEEYWAAMQQSGEFLRAETEYKEKK